MRNNKLLAMISLTRKAGKLVFGFDAVVEAAEKGEVKLIVFAEDLSARTKSSVEKAVNSGKYPPRMLDTKLSMFDYAQICGKPVGVLAIKDDGLATAITGLIKEESNIC